LTPGIEEAFITQVLPFARRDAYPFVGFELYIPKFAVFRDLGTFGQSENIRIGPSLMTELEFPIEALGSSADSIVTKASVGYVWADHDALVELKIEPASRFERGKGVDQLVRTMIRAATPTWLYGRLVTMGVWELRHNDTSNTVIGLGGSNGMRGYPSQSIYATGGNLIRGNIEYRTLPVVWQALHFGGVLFYDVGTVYKRIEKSKLYQSAGIGLRFLFPQFSRSVWRVDLGVPLTTEGFTVMFSFGSAQTLPLTPQEDLQAGRS
jgi:hypothetical protein